MTRVLVVEDDDSMARALQDGFQYEGYDVVLARDGATGLALAADVQPDVVILDVMLPKISGLDVCKQLRANGNRVPILMLTARGQEIDKVLGLKLGADDYVTKPFGFLELVARVEALLRRAQSDTAKATVEIYRFGDVVADFKQHAVSKNGRPVECSPRELRLLRYLVEHRGEVMSRDQLLDAVWDYDSPPLTRTVDMHVAKLRRKIEDDPADPRWIVTVHRIGYKFTG
jgi:two-component system alkaline phosphatase synthesis response regulator PhoP